MSCHRVRTHFCEVSSDDPKVEAIEENKQPKVHGALWLNKEQHADTEYCEHDDDVADDTSGIADLEHEEEPLIHKSGR